MIAASVSRVWMDVKTQNYLKYIVCQMPTIHKHLERKRRKEDKDGEIMKEQEKGNARRRGEKKWRKKKQVKQMQK